MGDLNYVASVIKILEKPIQTVINDKIIMTEFRAQFAQIRNMRMVTIRFWGNLALDIANYYQINDYIMIEGYLSLHNKKTNKLKKAQITVLKIYPIKN
jgi:hypothetical protein